MKKEQNLDKELTIKQIEKLKTTLNINLSIINNLKDQINCLCDKYSNKKTKKSIKTELESIINRYEDQNCFFIALKERIDELEIKGQDSKVD